MKQLSTIIGKSSKILDRLAGMVVMSVMLLVVANVIFRTVFNNPIKGTYEVVGLLTAVAVALGLAHCSLQKGHIAVEFVTDKLPKKMQKAIMIINHFVALILWSSATWYLTKYALTMMAKGLVTPTSEIPVYPFIFLVAFGFLMLSLSILSNLRTEVLSIHIENRITINTNTQTISEEII